MAEADAVYHGRAVRADLSSRDFESDDYGVLLTLEVDRWWKGGVGPRTQFLTGFGGGDCGLWSELGWTYLIVAHETESGQEYSGICSRSTITEPFWSPGLRDSLSIYLGPGRSPWPVSPGSVIGGLALALASLVGIITYRRRRAA